MKTAIIKDAINIKTWIYVGLLIGCLICYALIVQKAYALGFIAGCMPFIFICFFYIFSKPYISYLILFGVNYFVMGAMRYYYFPVWVVMDSLFAFIFVSLIFKASYSFNSWKNIQNGMFWSCIVWFIYCCLEFANPYGSTAFDWLQGVRAMSIYPLLTVIFVSVILNQYKDIKWLLAIWAVFTILAGMKGYWQRNHGFDATELTWLYSGGARTHLINTGIRFFSFFTDAGNYGASMGFSMTTFLITSLYIKNKWFKIFFLIAGLAGGYGMMISGTRGALAVPFAGVALFVLLSKNIRLITGGIVILVLALIFFNFTTIGNDNRVIRRMRTAFDYNDPSLRVRLNNQAKMRPAMAELPFGMGIGINTSSEVHYKNYVLISTPTDSELVRLWTRTGVVGLVLYLLIWGFIIIYGSYLILFKIKDRELRGILAAMLCGTFGMMVAAWGGENYTQYPNCILIYTCQTLVFLGPYFDRQIAKKKEAELKELTQSALSNENPT